MYTCLWQIACGYSGANWTPNSGWKWTVFWWWFLVVLCGTNHIVWPIKTIESVMIREIIRMKHKGISNSKISQSLGETRTAVLKYLCVIEVSGLKAKDLQNFQRRICLNFLKFQMTSVLAIEILYTLIFALFFLCREGINTCRSYSKHLVERV